MNLFLKLISDSAGEKIKQETKAWGMSKRRLAKLTYTDQETIESKPKAQEQKPKDISAKGDMDDF